MLKRRYGVQICRLPGAGASFRYPSRAVVVFRLDAHYSTNDLLRRPSLSEPSTGVAFTSFLLRPAASLGDVDLLGSLVGGKQHFQHFPEDNRE